MTWVRVDDRANEHRKLIDAGPLAAWLWACGLMYCNRQKALDGFIADGAVPGLYGPLATSALKFAAKLVEVGLWERVPGGYRVHDYHQYQPSADSWAELQRKRAAAGAKGGKAKAAKRGGKLPSNGASKASSNLPGFGSNLPSDMPSNLPPTDSKVLSKSLPDPDPGSEIEDQIPPPSSAQDPHSEPPQRPAFGRVFESSKGDPGTEARIAKARADLERLSQDPSFQPAAGGTRR